MALQLRFKLASAPPDSNMAFTDGDEATQTYVRHSSLMIWRRPDDSEFYVQLLAVETTKETKRGDTYLLII